MSALIHVFCFGKLEKEWRVYMSENQDDFGTLTTVSSFVILFMRTLLIMNIPIEMHFSASRDKVIYRTLALKPQYFFHIGQITATNTVIYKPNILMQLRQWDVDGLLWEL